MSGPLENAFVRFEPVREDNVALLLGWVLDPAARGPYRTSPGIGRSVLRRRMLGSGESRYYVLRRAPDAAALGWGWWRPWRFRPGLDRVDWQVDVVVVEPALRGFGFELAALLLAADHLLSGSPPASVFALTHLDDVPQQRSLRQAGFRCLGRCPHPDYPIPPPGIPGLLYARELDGGAGARPAGASR